MNTREVTHQYRQNQWMEIIRECRSSGQTVSAWCAEHDINPKSYYITFPTTSTGSANQKSSSDIVLHFGGVKLEINNTASAALIKSTLRAMKNVRYISKAEKIYIACG